MTAIAGTLPTPIRTTVAAPVRAEMRRLGRWPTMWILSGTWLVLNLTFGYLLPYLTYRSQDGTGFGAGATRQQLLSQLVPGAVPVTLVQGLPMFGGALLMILGALTTGSGYGWGTWKTVLTTGQRRGAALSGTYAAVAVIVVVLMVATLGLDIAASSIIGGAEGQSLSLPGLGDLTRSFGAALLIGAAWTAFGLLLGTLTRGPALAVGLGLVWALVVENLLRGVATVLDGLSVVTNVLPGTAAGSVAGALGAAGPETPDGTPGVNTILTGTTATLLLVAYLVVFVGISFAITRRRDLTS
jgi:ABC-type transport system involved in multi-copper enzyme maturation permease subunit